LQVVSVDAIADYDFNLKLLADDEIRIENNPLN
jgi:hypothetical protein